jgi:hypothetical protein
MWIYNEILFTEEMIGSSVGFVYEIVNNTNGKRYIGKKLFTKSKRYQKNNKKKSKRVSSDWLTYTGSNDQLNNDIANGDTVTKYILILCKSKGWMTYHETKQILNRDCLLSDEFYNSWIQCKIRRGHLT